LKPFSSAHIRNFCIIAHIDHGKSTLADRLIELTGTVSRRELREQLLDDMDLERERGITIKARAVCMRYMSSKGQTYELNLIDTPGHVDFHYEVSRSLACCEGALLLVDAFQGVEAQTVANAFAAMESGHSIVPVLNKVDLVHARPEQVMEEMEHSLGIDPAAVLPVSAKTGLGVEALLEAIVERVPPPAGDPAAALQAMVFDSHYDEFRGAITYVRLMNGTVTKGQRIKFLKTGYVHEVLELGQFVPQRRACNALQAGQVGYLICNIKSLSQVHIGDTVSSPDDAAAALPGYQEPKRMVFCGLYPSDGENFEELREALTKLSINDPSFIFEPETSDALGFGFRCGFLGLLHMEIIQQRLEQESNLDLVQTAPNVTYEIVTKTGETMRIYNPQKVPDAGEIEEFRQPVVKVSFVLPTESIGPVMQLCTDRRGEYVRTEYLSPTRAMLVYNLPLAEVIYDLHDKLKSCTRGYGTMDYELVGYFPANLVRLDILVGGKRVDALSVICDRADADRRGRAIVKKLRGEIDRHMFEVAIQAAIGSRIIARETISAMRKNVTAKCYGGDITRKRKLWAKQREGKKRMKSIGNVDIPQKAFLAVLETGGEK
jgi:GTP-binding protein LepA